MSISVDIKAAGFSLKTQSKSGEGQGRKATGTRFLREAMDDFLKDPRSPDCRSSSSTHRETTMNMKRIVKSLLVLLALCMAAPAISDPPAQSGPRVFRYNYDTAFVFSDFDSGLFVAFGVDMADYCFAEEEYEEFTFTDVFVNDDRILGPGYGEVYTEVWGFPEFDCARFTTEFPLAKGMITLRLNDNDVYAWAPNERSNKNSYSFKANGPMWSDTGERMQLHFVSHSVWGGFNNSSFEPKGFNSIRLD